MAGLPPSDPISAASGARRPVIGIVGPTAVGKSEAVLLLAARIGGEIVSVDSMQVYRGLDLGTAKPTPAERARVPHHLVDVVELSDRFDAARFVALARPAIEGIQRRGRSPVLCGGTGLYFKALLEGLGEAPPADPGLRAELERSPLPELLRELASKDPATFARIDRGNPRRVIRALEVIRLTGRPFSEQRAVWSGTAARAAPPTALRFFGLSRTAEDLRARIDARIDRMFERGLVEETRRLLERGLAQNRTAMQAIGYRQVVEHLRGERPLEATVALVKQRTWRFARRQMTWFRHQLNVTWLAVEPGTVATSTVQRILELAGPQDLP